MKKRKQKMTKEDYARMVGILKGGGLTKALLKSRQEDKAREERKFKSFKPSRFKKAT